MLHQRPDEDNQQDSRCDQLEPGSRDEAQEGIACRMECPLQVSRFVQEFTDQGADERAEENQRYLPRQDACQDAQHAADASCL